MAQYDDLNVGRITVVGVISIVCTAVTALAIQVVYYKMADISDKAKQEASDYRRQNAVLAAQAEQVSSIGVDPETGNLTIPVEEAMKRMVQDLGSSESASQHSSDKAIDET